MLKYRIFLTIIYLLLLINTKTLHSSMSNIYRENIIINLFNLIITKYHVYSYYTSKLLVYYFTIGYFYTHIIHLFGHNNLTHILLIDIYILLNIFDIIIGICLVCRSKSIINKIDNIDEDCVICLDKEGDWCEYSICHHKFHINCFKSWYEINKSCPICRAILVV
jgi:hypothetical protein